MRNTNKKTKEQTSQIRTVNDASEKRVRVKRYTKGSPVVNSEILRIKKARESICTDSDKRRGKYGYKGRDVVNFQHRRNARVRGGRE